MAMESAAEQDDELSRADAPTLDLAIRHFLARWQKRVHALQDDSSHLCLKTFRGLLDAPT